MSINYNKRLFFSNLFHGHLGIRNHSMGYISVTDSRNARNILWSQFLEKESSKDTLPLGSRDSDLLPFFLYAHNYDSLHITYSTSNYEMTCLGLFYFHLLAAWSLWVVLTLKEMPNQESEILGTLCKGQTFCFSGGRGFAVFPAGDTERLLFRRWGYTKRGV